MITPRYDKIVGFTGHQALSPETRESVRAALLEKLSSWGRILGITSLAAGSDQIFAECILASGGQLLVVIPSHRYEGTFSNPVDLATYQKLLRLATNKIELTFDKPGEAAYWAAGKRMVDMSDMLLAVWDGQPSGGLGGTADVVDYAKKHNKEVVQIWPSGASRT